MVGLEAPPTGVTKAIILGTGGVTSPLPLPSLLCPLAPGCGLSPKSKLALLNFCLVA